jgi:hypothetical protein
MAIMREDLEEVTLAAMWLANTVSILEYLPPRGDQEDTGLFLTLALEGICATVVFHCKLPKRSLSLGWHRVVGLAPA